MTEKSFLLRRVFSQHRPLPLLGSEWDESKYEGREISEQEGELGVDGNEENAVEKDLGIFGSLTRVGFTWEPNDAKVSRRAMTMGSTVRTRSWMWMMRFGRSGLSLSL